MNEIDIKTEFNERYEEAFRAWDGFLREAYTDLDFVTGDAWDRAEKEYLRRNRREALNWNKMKRIVRLVSGYQRKNRLSFRVQAEESGDDAAASQFSQLLQFIMERSNGYYVMSDAFEQGALKTGINLVEIGVDYDDDPVSGDIRLYRIPYNRFLLDPDIVRRDLSDCNYILRREWVDKHQAMALFPKRAKDISKLSPAAQHDNKFTFALKTHGADRLLRWDEYWRRDVEKRTIIIDAETGDWWIMPRDAKKVDIDQFIMNYPRRVIREEIFKPVVKLTIFIEEQVFYDDLDPLGIDDYPFVPVMGDWNPEHHNHAQKLASLIRDIRDPQRELNKRRSKILDILDSQISSGWIVEEGSVINPKDLYLSGQGKVIWTTKGSIQAARLHRIDPPEIPAGLFQFQDIMDRDIMEIPGANNELFGIPDRDQTQTPGLLAKLRQSQGLTTLQSLFDNYRLSKTLLGTKMLAVIQQQYDAAKVTKILHEPPAPGFYDKDFRKYRVSVSEGVLTDTQRQMYYQELVALKVAGAPIPWSAIVDAAPIQRRDDLAKIVQAEEQAAAQQMQRQQQLEQVQIQAMLAKAREDVANAVAEGARADEDRANAQLQRIKALAEIDKIGADRIKVLAEALRALGGSVAASNQPGAGQPGMGRRVPAMVRR